MPKTSYTVIRSGAFKSGRDLQGAIERVLGPALRRGGLVLEGGIKAVTPVRTGNLRRSTNTSTPTWRGRVYLVKVGPRAVYASLVNSRGRSRGYIKRGVDASIAKARSEIKRGALQLNIDNVWVKK